MDRDPKNLSRSAEMAGWRHEFKDTSYGLSCQEAMLFSAGGLCSQVEGAWCFQIVPGHLTNRFWGIKRISSVRSLCSGYRNRIIRARDMKASSRKLCESAGAIDSPGHVKYLVKIGPCPNSRIQSDPYDIAIPKEVIDTRSGRSCSSTRKRNTASVIARPGSCECTGIRLAGQSWGKSFYLIWIPACAGMTDKARSCFIRGPGDLSGRSGS